MFNKIFKENLTFFCRIITPVIGVIVVASWMLIFYGAYGIGYDDGYTDGGVKAFSEGYRYGYNIGYDRGQWGDGK
jgi:hypothetical protein